MEVFEGSSRGLSAPCCFGVCCCACPGWAPTLGSTAAPGPLPTAPVTDFGAAFAASRPLLVAPCVAEPAVVEGLLVDVGLEVDEIPEVEVAGLGSTSD